MTDLEPHPHLPCPVVHQQNRENAVRDHGLHKLRRALQQRLQVQRGIQSIGQLHQVSHIRLFHAIFPWVIIRSRVCQVGRAVVALILWFSARRWRSL